MQITTITTVFIAALTASASAKTECYRQDTGLNKWFVKADNVKNYSDVCGGLWDNLKGESGCGTPSETSCGERDGRLRWVFKVPSTCSGSKVQNAWIAATHNKYGGIECK